MIVGNLTTNCAVVMKFLAGRIKTGLKKFIFQTDAENNESIYEYSIVKPQQDKD